jgi:hypothetical protein
MNTLDIVRIVNMFLALATLPSSAYLLAQLIRESIKCPKPEVSEFNKWLRVLFAGMSLLGFLNAVLAFMALCGTEFYVNNHSYILNARNIVVNATFCISSWGILLLQKKVSR